MGDDCATGVAFTRNPSTGGNEFYGEFLVNAQGEDVVAGIRTPQPLTVAGKKANRSPASGHGRGDARVFAELERGAAQAREALPRHAGHRVHDRARQALYAADPHRQAHGPGGAQDRRRDGERRADHQRRGGLADRAGAPSTSCCIRRSIPRPRARSSRAACRPRRALRPGAIVFTRRRGRGPGRQGREGDPGPHRDQPRGHPRHACRRGHPDHPRRHDQPRRGRRPRHGAPLRRRRRRSPHRRASANDESARCRGERRRPSSPSTAAPAR